jgi:hypothetical protein
LLALGGRRQASLASSQGVFAWENDVARPEVTGRDPHRRGAASVPIHHARDAIPIPEFCQQHSISRAQYYVLKKKGLGPDEMRLLGRVLITREAAARWRKKHTRSSSEPELVGDAEIERDQTSRPGREASVRAFSSRSLVSHQDNKRLTPCHDHSAG